MTYQAKQELINYLSDFVSETTIPRYSEILNNRTKHITVALENIYQPHNASAVLRTCECFGIQDVHIIENKYKYNLNPDVVVGSEQWIDLIRYNDSENNTPTCYEHLRKAGYKIIATSPHSNDTLLEDFPINDKIALVFGTEREGLSEYAMNNADAHLRIPMPGFTESLNISVSAAICIHHLSYKLRNSKIAWQLKEEERQDILLQWLKRRIKNSHLIIDEYFKPQSAII